MSFETGDICSFCLGGEDDIPPFGKAKDAKELIQPCSTCTMTTHRKCLLDWFNSLSPDSIKKVSYSERVAEFVSQVQEERDHRRSQHEHELQEEETDNGSSNDDEDREEDFDQQNQHRRLTDDWDNDLDQSDSDFDDIDEERELIARLLNASNAANDNPDNNATTTIDINISPALINRWFLSLASDIRLDLRGSSKKVPFDDSTILLTTPCPQCKSRITVCIKRSLLLTLASAFRGVINTGIQSFGVMLGLTGAATGVITLGYVGISRVGLNILDCLIPSPLLISMLSKRNSTTLNSLRSFFPINNQSFNTIEDIVTKGVIDQFKFSHIPILPIILYRMRSSSIMDCLFSRQKNNSMSNWVTELMISNFISSLGNHQLIKSLSQNIGHIGRNLKELPLKSIPSFLTQGINIWDPNIMIGLLIPTRWAYDFLFRLIINTKYFDYISVIKPRHIANSVTDAELSNLEDLQYDLLQVKKKIEKVYQDSKSSSKQSNTLRASLLNSFKSKLIFIGKILSYNYNSSNLNLPWEYVKLKLKYWFYKSKTCMQTDYSTIMMQNSLTFRSLTTFIWPVISGELGRLINSFILNHDVFKNLKNIPKVNLRMMSNVIALILVVLIKDLINLYMVSRKVKQLSKMAIVKKTKKNNIQKTNLPGSYPN